jgi:hypothetical protein
MPGKLPKKHTKPALITTVALLAAGLVACGQEPSQPPPPPQVIEAEDAPAGKTFEEFGNYVVHFNAQPTTRLTAGVAEEFGIQRGEDRAMLNISVIDRSVEDAPVPVTAAVEVMATNLTGQVKDLQVRELERGDAIYYIGEFRVADQEIVNFDVSVRPEGMDAPYEFRFQQQFFMN